MILPPSLVPVGIVVTGVLLYGLIFALIALAKRRADQGKDIRE